MRSSIRKKTPLVLYIFIVVLFSCENPNPKDSLVTDVIAGYQDHILDKPYVAKASYYESASIDQKSCMFTEAYGYIASFGYSCPIPIDNFSFLWKNIRKSDRSKNWLALLKNTYQRDGTIKYQTDMPPGIHALFSGFRWFEKNGPLNEENRKDYSYRILDTINSEKDGKELIDMRFEENDNSSYSGNILIDLETSRIQSVYFDHFRYYSDAFRTWLDANGKIEYSYNSTNELYLSAINIHYSKNTVDYNIAFQSLSPNKKIILDVSEKNYNRLFSNDVRPYVYYDNWNPGPGLTFNGYGSVKKDISDSISLEKQYERNSEREYFKTITNLDKKVPVRGGKETYEIVKNTIYEWDKITRKDDHTH